MRIFYKRHERVSCFYFITTEDPGELVLQAERKVRPLTHIPDLDNANVGIVDVIFASREAAKQAVSFCFVSQMLHRQGGNRAEVKFW